MFLKINNRTKWDQLILFIKLITGREFSRPMGQIQNQESAKFIIIILQSPPKK